jgi:hypothetical protein
LFPVLRSNKFARRITRLYTRPQFERFCGIRYPRNAEQLKYERKAAMKKTKIVTCILCLSCIHLSAQGDNLKDVYTKVTTAINSSLLTRSGSIELSGAFSYNRFQTSFSDDEKMRQQIFLLEPVVSYFFINRLSLGLDFSYLNQKTDAGSSENSQTIEQSFIGPLIKWYCCDKRIRPFISADYLFMIGDNYEGGVFDLGAGLFYHVRGNFGFSLSAKYGFISSSDSAIDSQSRMFIGIGITNFIF